MVRFVQVVSNEKIINSAILKADQKFIIWWFWRPIGNLAFGHIEAYWHLAISKAKLNWIELNWIFFNLVILKAKLNWIELNFFQFDHFEGRMFIIELIPN
jgi:hypothetical protein